jgi:hypothetical protein
MTFVLELKDVIVEMGSNCIYHIDVTRGNFSNQLHYLKLLQIVRISIEIVLKYKLLTEYMPYDPCKDDLFYFYLL